MEFESRQFISQSECNRSDKLGLTGIQKFVSLLVLVLAACDAVMLFVINGFVLNYITLSYAIINVLIVLLCIGTLVWNYQQANYLSEKEDEWGEMTDNFNGRLLFFGSILLAIGEFVFFIMSILSTDYVVGLYESTSDSNDVVKFNNMVTIMKPIILVISILVVVGLIYSVYYFYQMTISSITSRFNIYLLCIAISLSCWGSVYLLRGLGLYPIDALLNIIILVLVLLAVISNTWKIKGLLMILAALEILLIPVLLGFQAQYIRDYQEKQDSNMENCQQLMNSLSDSYLAAHSCSHKYLTSTKTDCPNGEKTCEVYDTDCEREAQIQRWEVVSEDPADHPIGCLNLNCCKTVSSIFNRDLLILIVLSLSTPLFLFALILFEFHLSRRARTEKTLGRNIETLFLLLFIGTVVFGVLLLANNYHQIPIKEQVSFAEVGKASKAKEFSKIQTKMCQSVADLVGNRIELSSECKSTQNCPLNKVESGKKETNVLLGLWVKGLQQFKRKEATTYQSVAAAKFLWPSYDGNEQDFFAIMGDLQFVQQYLDEVQICYQIGSKELTINLYQNIVDVPIVDKQTIQHKDMFAHFAGTTPTPGTTSASGTSSTGSTPTGTAGTPTGTGGTSTGTGGAATGAGGAATPGGAQPPGPAKPNTPPKCDIPNCQECKDQKCTTCKTGYVQDDERGCMFSGKLGVSESIQVQLFKEMKSKVTGFIVGEIKKEGDQQYTQYPLAGAQVCWNQEGLEKPLCDQTTPKGDYKLQISTFDVADYSSQQFQPTVGTVSVAAPGYDDYVQSQVVQFEDEINFGTVILRSNVTIPKPAAPTGKRFYHFADAPKPTTQTSPTAGGTAGGTSGTPAGGAAQPASGGAAQPASGGAAQPASGGATQPAAGGAAQPSAGGAAQPPGASPCKQGEYLDAHKKCQSTGCTNVANCKFCDKTNKCSSCTTDYQLQTDKSCLPQNGCSKPYTQNNCLRCSKDKEKCDEGYCDAFSTFDNGQCKVDYKQCATKIANCAFCTKDNKCAACEQGYKLNAGSCQLGDFSQIFQTQYYTSNVYVVDVMDWTHLESAKVDLRIGSCGSVQIYGTAKTNSDGKASFNRLIKGALYNLIVTHPDYSQNCYEFQDNEAPIVPLSKQLKSGQVRIVLEWQDENTNLDLQLSFNPTNTNNCLVGYLNYECTGAKYGTSSDGEYSFEAIQINTLTVSKYLIFVQNLGDDDYQSKLITSNAHIKYYVADMDQAAVTFVVPNDKQSEVVGTTEAANTPWLAWLVGCIDAEESEIPKSLISQNGVWWTSSLNRWYPEIPQKNTQNFPSPKICDI